MKNFYQTKVVIAVAVATVAACLSSCKKGTVADPNNEYVNGVAHPPTSANETTSPAPVLNTMLPGSALPNSVITLTGNNFNVGNVNTVTINGVNAPVTVVSNLQLLVTIPANATSGKLILTSGPTVVTYPVDLTVTKATVSTRFNLGSNYLEHIAVDDSGNFYGDNGSTAVLRILPDGTISNFAGPFGSAWGTVVDHSGNVYVADRSKHLINRISPEGELKTYVGSGVADLTNGSGVGVAQFTNPTGLAIDRSGNLYTTDIRRVRKISNTGLVSTLAGSEVDGTDDGTGTAAHFGVLEGIVVDGDGNIYVSDTKYHNIRKITPAGVVTTFAGSTVAGFADGVGTAAQFTHPQGMAIDAAGNIFVSDNLASATSPIYTIRMVNKLGVVTTFLKGTALTGVINGPQAAASVNFPDGIAFDVGGSMYIVNTGANVVSKVVFN